MSGVAVPESGSGDGSAAGPSIDQLNFLDLLYAVPIGDLAMRVSGAQLNLISAADWSALTLILAVIVLSWVGLHKDRAIITAEQHVNRIGDIDFRHIEFSQLLIEVGIIAMYFAMGLTLQLPPKNGKPPSPPPSEVWLTGFLLAVFAAYWLWDRIDILRARRENDQIWRRRATRGARVTLSAALVAAVVFVAVWLTLHPARTEGPVVALNLALVVLLYLYRVAQERWGNTATDAPVS